MRRYPRPRRFSIRRNDADTSEKRRFDFHKYRKKRALKAHYILWFVIVFAVVFFLIRYLSNMAR